MATAISLALNTSAKSVTLTGDEIAERETVNVTLTNTSQYTGNSSDLILGIINRGTLVASLGTTSNLFTTSYTGALNLNTCELTNAMGNRIKDSNKRFSLALWDITGSDLLVNDTIQIQNNPYTTTMSDPTAVAKIGYGNSTSFTVALRAKLDGIEALADVTDSVNVNAAGALMNSDFTNADSLMVANTSGTPSNLQLGTSTMVGNTTGVVKAMTPAQIRTLINVDDGANAVTSTVIDTHGGVLHGDFSSNGLIARTGAGTYAYFTAPSSTVVSRTDYQVLTNKTLTSPGINSTTLITADSAEINFLATANLEAGDFTKLAALTATAAEINKIDGYTGTFTMLNFLATTGLASGDFRKLADVTASTAEINILDGVTASTAELNIMDGVTASTAELNTLDGITSNVTELNLLDGFTEILTTVADTDAKLVTAGAVVDYVTGFKIDNLTKGDDNTDLNATSTYHGLSPKRSGVATQFLNGAGAWTVPAGSGDAIAPATNTSHFIPTWSTANSKTLLNGLAFSTDGTLTANSTAKIVAEKAIKTYVDALKLDDTASPDDNTDNNASSTAHGLLAKLPGDSGKFMDGTGTWANGFTYYGTAIKGNILYSDGSSWAVLAPSTAGYFLQTNTSTAIPSWNAMRYQTSFTSSNLSSGVLTVGHDLGKQYLSSVNLINSAGEIMGPDYVDFTNSSSLTLSVASYSWTGTGYVICSL